MPTLKKLLWNEFVTLWQTQSIAEKNNKDYHTVILKSDFTLTPATSIQQSIPPALHALLHPNPERQRRRKTERGHVSHDDRTRIQYIFAVPDVGAVVEIENRKAEITSHRLAAKVTSHAQIEPMISRQAIGIFVADMNVAALAAVEQFNRILRFGRGERRAGGINPGGGKIPFAETVIPHQFQI